MKAKLPTSGHDFRKGYSMSTRSIFDDKYWNLAQAAAWVEYREKQLVNDFDAADRDDYMAIGMYPSMWPKGRKKRGRVKELHHALEQDQLKASAYRREGTTRLEEIPAAEWADYEIRPPLVCFVGQPQNQPWKSVRVLSADIKRLWRSEREVSGRSKYDWTVLQEIHNKLKTQNSEMSQNELITEIQGAYEDQFNKSGPSRSSVQNKIKAWS